MISQSPKVLVDDNTDRESLGPLDSSFGRDMFMFTNIDRTLQNHRNDIC